MQGEVQIQDAFNHAESCDVLTCSLIKDELEPYMRDFSPAVVSGMYFERLSFGLVPMSILGVRSVPSFHANQHVSIGTYSTMFMQIRLITGCLQPLRHVSYALCRMQLKGNFDDKTSRQTPCTVRVDVIPVQGTAVLQEVLT